MENNLKELILKLDYAHNDDVEKLISLIKQLDIKINKIGNDEYVVAFTE